MWTSLKENSEYSAQITPYHGYVHAEIINRSGKEFLDHKLGLWLTAMDKSFGSFWQKAPTQKNWQDANMWIKVQLELIGKYGTVMVTKPKHLRDSEEWELKQQQ